MLLIDDMLFAPLHGLLWIARKVDEAVSQEQEKEEEELQARLRELHLRLEAGQLGEAEFEEQESALLDRLDAIAERKGAASLEEEPVDAAEREHDHDAG
jgi:hypothetical protein